MRRILYALSFLLICTRMMGQNPVAAFTSSSTSGCAPLIVSFTDQTTGSPLFWNWDFGNGTLSTLQNPTVVYYAPGVYTVKMAVRNANGADGITKTNYITVYPSPTAAFTANNTVGCAPSSFQFTDASTDPVGTIVKWNWAFSDGTISTTRNPLIQFTNVGFYDVTLTVTSSTGCTGSVSTSRYIRVVPGVKADFTYTTPTTCRPPFKVDFTNQTSGPGTLTYNWDFGNSGTSTQTNDSTIYNTAGSYTVKLSAQSSYGCQNTVQKTITTTSTIPSFTSTGACIGSVVNFQNTSSPAPVSLLWKFGDSTQSTQQNPVKTYPRPGAYPVTLVGNYAGCTDSVTQTITIHDKPVVDFTAPHTRTCKPNLQVNFQDLSAGAKIWNWDFGDGSNSTLQNPSHTYTSFGQFDVTLTITDTNGCQNTLTKGAFVQIVAPSASIGNVPAGGCAPYSFTANSNSYSAEGIASYFWDFGDAGATSTLANPTHTYATTGNYTLQLTITTTDGCTSTVSVPNAVSVGTPAAIDFSTSTSPVCRSSVVTFNDLTSPSGLPLFWEFGDGFTGIGPNPTHKYSDTGSYNVTLIANNNGCRDTLTKPGFIKVLGPVARFNYTVDCASKTLVNFRDSSVIYPPPAPVPSYTWSFGDPLNSTATGTIASFNYPATWPVSYTVRLVVNDGTCADTVIRPVLLVNEPAGFSISKSPACRNESISFSAATSNPANIRIYAWSIDGAPPVIAPGTYVTSFANAGVHTIQLTITDINGCVTVGAPQSLTITGPNVSFTIANDGGCKNKPVQFTDNSTSGGGAITSWSWNFGDGSTGPFTTQNPSHTYADSGLYNVTLTVTDVLGCSDALTKMDTIAQPLAAFGTDTTLFCPGGPMQFKDSSTGRRIQSWIWNFGDGGSATVQNPVHIYTGGDAVYSVKLTIGDAFGCSDSVTRTNYIVIKKPKSAFGVKDSTTICPPLQTNFFFQGKDYQSFSWDFGDGGTSTLLNPSHFYNSYGVDTVKLYLVGFGGCLDSATSVVHLYNPYTVTSLVYNPLNACNQLNVDFTLAYPPSTKSYLYFGDGAIDSSQQTSLQHLYTTPSFNTPLAQLSDSEGCIVLVYGSQVIKILGAVPVFGMDRKKFCDSGVVNFTNFTINNDPIVSETWDFGDGSNSTITTPVDASHDYLLPGLYVTSLTATTQAGCVKALTDTVRVLRTPDPQISSASAVCMGGTVDFQGSLLVPDTAISWNWDLGNGQGSTQQQTSGTYPIAGKYTVRLQAANSLGCKDTTSEIILVNSLPSIKVNGDTVLMVGGGINIPMQYGPGVVSYNWTPATNLSCTDCASPYANPRFTTTYKVTVTDSNDCSSSRFVTLITLCNNKNFFIPNTFSPNRDGVNDVFYPRGTGIDRIQAMRIFDRWGELIFEKRFFPANDPTSGWDGTYKGKPANSDTYIYMIDIICENATIITYKGNVTLIR